MNERIKELITKAWCIPPDDFLEVSWDIEEKFAELIVKECAELVEGFTIEQEVALDQYNEYEASAVLKEHFGVDK